MKISIFISISESSIPSLHRITRCAKRDLVKRITNLRVCFSSSQSLLLSAGFPLRGRYGNGFELIESLAKKKRQGMLQLLKRIRFIGKWDSERWKWKSLSLWHLILMYPFSERLSWPFSDLKQNFWFRSSKRISFYFSRSMVKEVEPMRWNGIQLQQEQDE